MITIVSSRVCADQQELLEEKEDEEAALYRGVAPGEVYLGWGVHWLYLPVIQHCYGRLREMIHV